jgi:putative membrane protein
MLRYRADHFSEILVNFYRSQVLRRVLGADLLIGVYAAAIVWAGKQHMIPAFKVDPAVFPVMTLLLSFLLAFRTNGAYDRWWEGRKQLGALVNATRNLALMLAARLPEDGAERRRTYAREISAFTAALNHHLRRDLDVEMLSDLEAEDKEFLRKLEHVPLALSARLARRVEEDHAAGVFSGFQLLDLQGHVAKLMDIGGACERIKNTPIPFSYSSYLKNLLLLFCMLMPIGLQSDNGYLSVPIVMLVFGCLVGLELLAADIEDPFGYQENDLPIGRLTHMIRRNVHEVLVGARPEDEVVPSKELEGIEVAI